MNFFINHPACESYHLPEHVKPHIDFVTPSVHFDAVIGKRSNPAHRIGQPGAGSSPKTTGTIENLFTDLENCDKQITPICLRALYGLVYEPLSGSKNSFGIGSCATFRYNCHSEIDASPVEYTPQAYVQSDLDKFFTNFSSSQVGSSPVLESIDGGTILSLAHTSRKLRLGLYRCRPDHTNWIFL
jgi:tripeptidyl-peptidase I